MKIKYLLFPFILLLSFNTYAGGGWTKKKGTSYIKVSGWWVESKGFFSGNGSETQSTVENGLFNVNVYAEYGISDKLTAIGYVPFFTRSYQNTEVDQNGNVNEALPGGDLNTFGDSEIGIKYSVYKNGRFAIATSLTLGLPFGNDGADEELGLATGDEEFNQLLRVDVGVSLVESESLSLYGNAYLGYNHRTEGFSDEYRFGAELGLGLIEKKLWLISKVDFIESTENGDRNFDNAGGSIFANNAEVVNLSFEASYYLSKKIGVSVSTAIPLDGVFVYSEPAYSGGVFFDLK